MKQKLVVISTLIAIGALLAACAGASPEGGHLKAVKAAGVIRVGTSPDYPPFESVNKKGVRAGFDIDLMTEVAARLGVSVEWLDMPFEDLIPAVQDGKVDAAIAAFLYTKERDQAIDFTAGYYALEDALVAAEAFNGKVTKDEDVTAYRTGVLKGSSQDQWLAKTLQARDTPLKGKLFRYSGIKQAALALTKGSVDLLLLDSASANGLVGEQTGLKIVFHGALSNQPLQIIVPEGDAGLRQAIDEVIGRLRDEGFLDELASSYFQE